MRRSLAFLLPIVTMTVALVATTPAIARQPMSLGAAVENNEDMAEVDAFRQRTGAKPRLWALWSSWGDRKGSGRCVDGLGSCAFPTEAAKGLRSRGITPIIWWQPTEPGNEDAGQYGRYKLIAAGEHDAYIRDWARAAKRFGRPVVVRMAHEMNGDWFEWSVVNHDNNPYLFKKAWRHVVKQFRKVGARNVKFLWSPYLGGTHTYARLYPGNAYVDYVGVTSLNWGEARWTSMVEILDKPMARLRKITHTRRRPLGKPVILPELASNDLGGNKAAWIKNGYQKVYKKWPAIKAIVYFDYDTTFARQPDWRLIKPSNGSALKSYRSIATQKRFKTAFP